MAADTAAEGRPPEASNPSHANNSAGHNRCQRAWVAACRPPWAEGLGDRNTWRGASAACAPWADWACREGWAEADFGSHTPWACRSSASQRDNLHDTLEILTNSIPLCSPQSLSAKYLFNITVSGKVLLQANSAVLGYSTAGVSSFTGGIDDTGTLVFRLYPWIFGNSLWIALATSMCCSTLDFYRKAGDSMMILNMEPPGL